MADLLTKILLFSNYYVFKSFDIIIYKMEFYPRTLETGRIHTKKDCSTLGTKLTFVYVMYHFTIIILVSIPYG